MHGSLLYDMIGYIIFVCVSINIHIGLSKNRESNDNKVENHDINLSHAFLWERWEKSLSISLKRITSFYFSE